MRVQIPTYTDRWAMGDRYGEVIKTTTPRQTNAYGTLIKQKVAHVRLDQSGKVVRVVLDHCTEVE